MVCSWFFSLQQLIKVMQGMCFKKTKVIAFKEKWLLCKIVIDGKFWNKLVIFSIRAVINHFDMRGIWTGTCLVSGCVCAKTKTLQRKPWHFLLSYKDQKFGWLKSIIWVDYKLFRWLSEIYYKFNRDNRIRNRNIKVRIKNILFNL